MAKHLGEGQVAESTLRDHPNHRERGPSKRSFTLQGLADAAGLSLGTVYNHRPDTTDLRGIAHYIQTHRRARSRKVRPFEVAAVLRPALGPFDLDDVALAGRWEDRWPRVTLWLCGEDARLDNPKSTGCVPLLAQGFCEAHGGGKAGLCFLGRYLGVRIDKGGLALHRLVVGDPSGMVVHHVDGNWWNNRQGNLAVMTAAEHFVAHHGEP